MSFRDDRQACVAIKTMLDATNLPAIRGLWTTMAPTKRAFELLDSGELSSGELTLLRVAFDLWNGEGGAKVADLVHGLDSRRLHLVTSLMIAMSAGADQVDAWIARTKGGVK